MLALMRSIGRMLDVRGKSINEKARVADNAVGDPGFFFCCPLVEKPAVKGRRSFWPLAASQCNWRGMMRSRKRRKQYQSLISDS
jgi:hypothetical protein